MTLSELLAWAAALVVVGFLVGFTIEALPLLRWPARVVAVAIVLGSVSAVALVVERRRIPTPPGTPIAQPPPDLGAPECPSPERHGEMLAPIDERTQRAAWRARHPDEG